jgi:hypothetical protein
VNAWRAAESNERLLLTLAAELPEVLAAAAAESHAMATGMAKAPLAGILAATWYQCAAKTLDALRAHHPSIPEVTAIPPAIERLREIARR